MGMHNYSIGMQNQSTLRMEMEFEVKTSASE